MELVKGESVTPGARSYLIIGVEKSGKTSFIGTAANYLAAQGKRLLVFAGEPGTLQRLGGIPNIDFVLVYPTKEDFTKAGAVPAVKSITDQEKRAARILRDANQLALKRFNDAYTELLLGGSPNHAGGAIDSANYIQDKLLEKIEEINGKTGFDLWREARKQMANYTETLQVVFDYYFVTVHVKTNEDETTNREMFTAALQGSYRDVIGGKFDAVFHAVTRPSGTTVQYLLQAHPDSMRKAGIRVPFGKEDTIVKELPNDFGKIMAIIKGEKAK